LDREKLRILTKVRTFTIALSLYISLWPAVQYLWQTFAQSHVSWVEGLSFDPKRILPLLEQSRRPSAASHTKIVQPFANIATWIVLRNDAPTPSYDTYMCCRPQGKLKNRWNLKKHQLKLNRVGCCDWQKLHTVSWYIASRFLTRMEDLCRAILRRSWSMNDSENSPKRSSRAASILGVANAYASVWVASSLRCPKQSWARLFTSFWIDG
jgi:hypothetical protein